jgi:hypothetical protein
MGAKKKWIKKRKKRKTSAHSKKSAKTEIHVPPGV